MRHTAKNRPDGRWLSGNMIKALWYRVARSRFTWICATLIILALVMAPAITGLVVRHQLDALRLLDDTYAGSDRPLTVRLTGRRAGWFYSQYNLELQGEVLSADGSQPVAQAVVLSVAHGPVIWHLLDTLFGIAEFQLFNADQTNAAATAHLSGSGMLTVNRHGNLKFKAILGFTALAGQHWLDVRLEWPVFTSTPPWPPTQAGWPGKLDLLIDADARALAQGPAADALQVYQMQGWTRISGGRAFSTISLQGGILDINGTQLPLQLFNRAAQVNSADQVSRIE